MIGLPSSRLRRALAAAAPLVVALWLLGCANYWEYARYPEGLAYPARSDLIVVEAPKSIQPFSPAPPGRLDESIAEWAQKGGKVIDPRKVDPGLRAAITDAVKGLFGTPRHPRVGADDADKDVVDQLVALKLRDDDAKAPFKSLAHGSELYRYHCLHCHGLTGDGRGPTGPWVDPHPRDYRRGAFKFISTDLSVGNRKPRRDDLLRTLRQGIEGTSMPSFRLLADKDLDDLASYVIHLSMRGQIEAALISKSPVGDGSLTTKEDCGPNADDAFANVLQQWVDSNAKPSITPSQDAYTDFGDVTKFHSARERDEARAASIRHGYQLFSDPKGDASCISCHTDYGRQVNFRYDDWGTLVRPRDLTAGVFRGGRRPIDLYWRIKGGIGPAGMPPTGLKSDKDIWDVVNFVEALPYPQMLPADPEHPDKDVRYKIYDRPPDEHAAEHVAERAER